MILPKFIVLSEDGVITSIHDDFENGANAATYMANTMPGASFKVYKKEFTALVPAKPKVRMLNKKEPA